MEFLSSTLNLLPAMTIRFQDACLPFLALQDCCHLVLCANLSLFLLQKCLISGMWLMPRRYPVPAVHGGAVYRASRPVSEINQVG